MNDLRKIAEYVSSQGDDVSAFYDEWDDGCEVKINGSTHKVTVKPAEKRDLFEVIAHHPEDSMIYVYHEFAADLDWVFLARLACAKRIYYAEQYDDEEGEYKPGALLAQFGKAISNMDVQRLFEVELTDRMDEIWELKK